MSTEMQPESSYSDQPPGLKSGESEENASASGSKSKPEMFGGERAPEFGGREGPEPTRYGDWEKNGRCIDF